MNRSRSVENLRDDSFSVAVGPMSLAEREYLLKTGQLLENSMGELYGEESTLSDAEPDVGYTPRIKAIEANLRAKYGFPSRTRTPDNGKPMELLQGSLNCTPPTAGGRGDDDPEAEIMFHVGNSVVRAPANNKRRRSNSSPRTPTGFSPKPKSGRLSISSLHFSKLFEDDKENIPTPRIAGAEKEYYMPITEDITVTSSSGSIIGDSNLSDPELENDNKNERKNESSVMNVTFEKSPSPELKELGLKSPEILEEDDETESDTDDDLEPENLNFSAIVERISMKKNSMSRKNDPNLSGSSGLVDLSGPGILDVTKPGNTSSMFLEVSSGIGHLSGLTGFTGDISQFSQAMTRTGKDDSRNPVSASFEMLESQCTQDSFKSAKESPALIQFDTPKSPVLIQFDTPGPMPTQNATAATIPPETPGTRIRKWIDAVDPKAAPVIQTPIIATPRTLLRRSLRLKAKDELHLGRGLGIGQSPNFFSTPKAGRVSGKYLSFEESDKNCSIHVKHWEKYVMDYPGSEKFLSACGTQNSSIAENSNANYESIIPETQAMGMGSIADNSNANHVSIIPETQAMGMVGIAEVDQDLINLENSMANASICEDSDDMEKEAEVTGNKTENMSVSFVPETQPIQFQSHEVEEPGMDDENEAFYSVPNANQNESYQYDLDDTMANMERLLKMADELENAELENPPETFTEFAQSAAETSFSEEKMEMDMINSSQKEARATATPQKSLKKSLIGETRKVSLSTSTPRRESLSARDTLRRQSFKLAAAVASANSSPAPSPAAVPKTPIKSKQVQMVTSPAIFPTPPTKSANKISSTTPGGFTAARKSQPSFTSTPAKPGAGTSPFLMASPASTIGCPTPNKLPPTGPSASVRKSRIPKFPAPVPALKNPKLQSIAGLSPMVRISSPVANYIYSTPTATQIKRAIKPHPIQYNSTDKKTIFEKKMTLTGTSLSTRPIQSGIPKFKSGIPHPSPMGWNSSTQAAHRSSENPRSTERSGGGQTKRTSQTNIPALGRLSVRNLESEFESRSKIVETKKNVKVLKPVEYCGSEKIRQAQAAAARPTTPGYGSKLKKTTNSPAMVYGDVEASFIAQRHTGLLNESTNTSVVHHEPIMKSFVPSRIAQPKRNP